MGSKYFGFNAEKALYLAGVQTSLPQGSFFSVVSNNKIVTTMQTIVLDQSGNRIVLNDTRPVFVLETDLVDLFADLQANSEFSSESSQAILDYLGTPDNI